MRGTDEVFTDYEKYLKRCDYKPRRYSKDELTFRRLDYLMQACLTIFHNQLDAR